MKEIPLTQGKVALVDDEDYERLNKYKWHAHKHRNNFYAYRNTPRENGKQTNMIMHRVVLGISDRSMVDHRDGDGLNNQKYNLRPCTNSQNMCNAVAHKRNPSGYKGVTINKRRGRYHARITHNYHLIYLGYFSDPIDAALAYSVAAILLHGEFARTSFQGRKDND
jgi:hypothetical protein